MIRDNTKSNDFRSNLSVGGEACIITPPEDAVALGRKIRQVSGLNICGIDLLFGKDGFMVGEVNSLPGFPTGEEYDGEPVGKRYHRMLMEYMMKIKD